MSTLSTMNSIPQGLVLPRIEGDSEIQFQILTHKSVHFSGAPEQDVEEYGNVQRLAHLGRQMFSTAVSIALFQRKPPLDVKGLADEERFYISEDVIAGLVQQFGLHRRIRTSPEVGQLTNPQDLAYVWNAWFGAVYIRSGLSSILAFVGGLVNPDQPSKPMESYPTTPDPYSQAHQLPQLPAYQHLQPPTYMHMSPPPPQPPVPPPPAPPPPMSQPHRMHMNSYQPKVTLALFNERASQIGFVVTYPATMTGPAHSPLWVVHCCVNGQQKGIGQGRSQKIAKEQAAQMAWENLGFA